MHDTSQTIRIGRFTVTRLIDGFFPIGLELISGANNPRGRELLAQSGRPRQGPSMEPVCGFLIETEGKRWLVDAGCGNLYGDGLGQIEQAIRHYGLTLDAIDAVVLTHMHPDHIGGLLTPAGIARYPRAELIVQGMEVDHWSSEAASGAGETSAEVADLAKRTMLAYSGRVRRTRDDEQIDQGLRCVPLPGHTPGHMGVFIADQGEELLIWGDIVHCATLQLVEPSWSIAFDVSPEIAIATRTALLTRVVNENTRITGMHLDGIGHLTKDAAGYHFVSEVRFDGNPPDTY